jgi:hypothetical protein
MYFTINTDKGQFGSQIGREAGPTVDRLIENFTRKTGALNSMNREQRVTQRAGIRKLIDQVARAVRSGTLSFSPEVDRSIRGEEAPWHER